MSSTRWVCTGLITLAGAGASAGCSGDFDPYNRVAALRVLAIRSEPVAPAPGEAATLTSLVYAPEGDVVAYEWSWCPLTGDSSDGFPCLVSEDDVRATFGAAVPPFELGAGESVRFENAFEPGALARLCAGDAAFGLAALDCQFGFPVTLRLVVRTAGDEVVSVRRLFLRLGVEQPLNQNPSIDALEATLDEVSLPLDDTASVTLPRNRETAVRAVVPEASAETYTALDDPERPVAARERLVFTWFVETGETEFERTSFIDAIPLDQARQNRWQPASSTDYPRETARLVLVLRDERGGVGWRSARVSLGGEP